MSATCEEIDLLSGLSCVSYGTYTDCWLQPSNTCVFGTEASANGHVVTTLVCAYMACIMCLCTQLSLQHLSWCMQY